VSQRPGSALSSQSNGQSMARVSYHRVRIATDSEDDEGLLAMVDGRLVAILTRLDAPFHGEQRGWWHECGFGRHDGRPDLFPTLADVTRWIVRRLDLTEDDLDGPIEIGRALGDDGVNAGS
jgi:hypothetical protein